MVAGEGPPSDGASSAADALGGRFGAVTAGNWTDAEARTGCTVLVFDRPALAAVDVRGGGPGTRETDLLGPARLVQRADAILLTGGSAFGLAAADGVVRSLAAAGRGFPTQAGPVPIVPAAVLFDRAVGRPAAPDAAAGAAAYAAAGPLLTLARGAVGAGTGATTGKLAGEQSVGGLGLAVVAWAAGAVAAVVAVNAAGDVVDPATELRVADPDAKPGDRRAAILGDVGTAAATMPLGTSTTLVAVVVAAPADHPTLQRCAVAAHDGLARTIRPCHTAYDGDTVFVATLDEGAPTPAEGLALAVACELAVERAVLDAVRRAMASAVGQA